MRYEKKFVLDQNQDLAQVRAWIMLETCAFRVAYPSRVVNNIYFDTFDKKALQENLAGVKEREKYRVRWYNTDSANAILECKQKKGLLGTKKTWQLEDLDQNQFDFLEKISFLTQKVNNLTLLKLEPTLINRYQREYYESFDRRFRLTLDYDIQYQNPSTNPTFFSAQPSNAPVLELKYDAEHEQEAKTLFKSFGFRQDKHSKYVNGVR